MDVTQRFGMGRGSIPLVSPARIRSISAENPAGEAGGDYWYQLPPHAPFPDMPPPHERWPR
jgi:hypothetical protein